MTHPDGPDWRVALVAGLLAALLAGCTGLGPARIGIDRTDYTERLRRSEKEQLLANTVALHHGDAPMFLGVSSVISQYTRESSGELHAAVSPAPDNDGGSIGGAPPWLPFAEGGARRCERMYSTILSPTTRIAGPGLSGPFQAMK